ncbi:hypothetical protein M0638_11160 [Roseomonas sp. NAR14]|uniref:Uncharacterized protein n=1 Tax=Roseomonas acroporae TaxID=2937791 RepID=A0A9X1Y9N7_9PROT|nr:hypothetical protein [Roseomonas acroporae]MCK8784940.1 hypothetical protein [Roseomonas acroporae]
MIAALGLGRPALLAGTALATLLLLGATLGGAYLAGHTDGAAAARRATLEHAMETNDAANRAAAEFRGDGLDRRLRNGRF